MTSIHTTGDRLGPHDLRAPLAVGTVIEGMATRYTILGWFVPAGGMSIAYLATDAGGAEWVVKECYPRVTPVDSSGFPQVPPPLVEAARAEAGLLSKFDRTSTPRLVEEVTSPRRTYCVVMEKLDGTRLSELRGARSPLLVSALVDSVGGVLQAMHASDYLHGDLSSGNVLLASGAAGSFRVIDLGGAVPADPRRRNPHRPSVFTPEWSAPERRSSISAASDTYSLALLASWYLDPERFAPRPPDQRPGGWPFAGSPDELRRAVAQAHPHGGGTAAGRVLHEALRPEAHLRPSLDQLVDAFGTRSSAQPTNRKPPMSNSNWSGSEPVHPQSQWGSEYSQTPSGYWPQDQSGQFGGGSGPHGDPPKKGNGGLIAALVALVVVIVAAGVVIALMADGDDDENADDPTTTTTTTLPQSSSESTESSTTSQTTASTAPPDTEPPDTEPSTTSTTTTTEPSSPSGATIDDMATIEARIEYDAETPEYEVQVPEGAEVQLVLDVNDGTDLELHVGGKRVNAGDEGESEVFRFVNEPDPDREDELPLPFRGIVTVLRWSGGDAPLDYTLRFEPIA